ncbi:MAG: hypothetical protein V3U58_05725 [Thermodesulfobacteriota bacterium]
MVSLTGTITKNGIWILVGLAFIVRTFGIGYGLPFKYGGTEMKIIKVAVSFDGERI